LAKHKQDVPRLLSLVKQDILHHQGRSHPECMSYLNLMARLQSKHGISTAWSF